MNITPIYAATRNFVARFSFTRPNIGDNALMTIKDGNRIINEINVQSPYRAVVFSLSTSNNGVTMMRVVNGGGGDQCVVCDPCGPGEDCGSVECYLPCRFVGAKASVISGITQIALGIYEVEVNTDLPFVANPRTVGVYPAALPSKDDQIEVYPIIGNKFQIKTYRAGVLSGLVLRNHAFKMEFYVYSMQDLKCSSC